MEALDSWLTYMLEYSEGMREAVVVSHRGGHMVPKVRACDHDQLITQPQLCIYCAQSANVPLRGEWKVLEVHGTSEKVRKGQVVQNSGTMDCAIQGNFYYSTNGLPKCSSAE